MAALAGPYLVTATLLGAGGALKVVRPGPTARALGDMGLPAPPALVRAGAVAEAGVALAALAGAGRSAAVLVAGSYLAFAGFVLVALRRGVPLSSCGCFGAQDTPPTVVHLVVNVGAALVAAAVAAGAAGGRGVAEIAAVDGPLVLRAAFVVLTAASVWLAYVALTLLPRVQGAAR